MRQLHIFILVVSSALLALAQRNPSLTPQTLAQPALPSRVLTRKALADLALRRAQSNASGLPKNSANTSTNASSIFLEAPTYDSGGVNANSITIADVNKDGHPDLLVANECDSLPSCSTGVVAVMLGNGNGTFQSPQTYDSGGLAAAVAVADVNGDGALDLLVANSFSDTAAVLLGHGDGTFGPAQTYDSGGFGALSIAVGDVNGDGKLDLLIANSCVSNFDCSHGSAAVLLGNGNGTFQPPTTYNSGGFAQNETSIAVADVNRDGKLDLLVSSDCKSGGSSGCTDTTGVVGVLLGNGDGTFQAATTYDSGGFFAQGLTVADVNGDHKLDLIVANDCAGGNSTGCQNGAVGVLLGNGDGSFQSAHAYRTNGPFAFSVNATDVNGDGKIDLVVSSAGIDVLFGCGNGTFRAPVTYGEGGYTSFSVAVADVSKDGLPDVITTSNCASSLCSGNGQVQVFLAVGGGKFHAARTYNAGAFTVTSIVAADVRGNGKVDLLMADACITSSCTGGAVGVALGNNDGSFRPVRLYPSTNFVFSIVTADVNLDGIADLLVSEDDPSTSAGFLEVLFGNGDGTFRNGGKYSSGGYLAVSLAVADLNGDGKPDLVISNQCAAISTCNTNSEAGSVGILLGNGDGTFQAARTYNSGGFYATSVAIADVNSDGKPDLLVANRCLTTAGCFLIPPAAGGVAVFLGNGDGTFQTAQSYNSGGFEGWSVGLGDVNGDGKADLLVINGCVDLFCMNGGLGVLLGNGDGTFQTGFAVTAFGSEFASGQQLALADFNGDGKLDVASGALAAFLAGKGDGTFQPPLALGVVGTTTAVGDFNADGRPDAVVSGSIWGFTVLLNASDVTPPTVTASPSPTTLWPPNGKMKAVQVSGLITDSGSGVNPSTAAYAVTDEYGQIQPKGSITIQAGGRYSFQVMLQASRHGTDTNGRQYTIVVSAQDNAGNVGSASTTVTVPH